MCLESENGLSATNMQRTQQEYQNEYVNTCHSELVAFSKGTPLVESRRPFASQLVAHGENERIS